MSLNSWSDISWLTSLYSGVARYFSNKACQSLSDSGGTVLTSGCHSAIESLEWVSRVMPPTTTIAPTSTAQARSHEATARPADAGAGPARVADASASFIVGSGFCPRVRRSAAPGALAHFLNARRAHCPHARPWNHARHPL